MEAGCDCSWLRCGCCASVSGELVSTALRVFCCGLRMLAHAMCLAHTCATCARWWLPLLLYRLHGST
jgi:hypothetical protein